MEERPSDSRGPCDGIRVLDFTTVISGPICTQALGDLGADVIKVEPPSGDPSRYSGGPFPEPGFSAFLAQFNRNKRSIVLDLASDAGRDVARRLAGGSDVLVQNFRPGVAKRLGIGWDELHDLNPRLVYASISGFGPDGPYVDLPAYDHVIQGLSGFMQVQGGDDAPRLVQGGVADKSSGLTALSAVLAALFARERGIAGGQQVEIPMLDAYAAFALPESIMPLSFPPLESNMPGVSAIFRTWPTADGHVVGLVIQDHQFIALCQAVERPGLAEDPRFSGIGERFTNFFELVPLLEEAMGKLTTEEFLKRARALGAPFAPTHGIDDFLADPQVAHNRTVFDSEDERFGTTRYLRHAARYSETPATLRRHAPRLGEHSAEVLGEAGYSEAEVDALRRSGALGPADA